MSQRHRYRRASWFALILATVGNHSSAAIIGTNTAALPLTVERIAALPEPERAPWSQYLARSARMRQADQAALQTELRQRGTNVAVPPPEGRASTSMPMQRPLEWYAGPEAGRVADIILSFQTPAGGWSKNLDFARRPRLPGEHFAAGNHSRFPSPEDHDAPREPAWNFVGTFDNDGTTAQLAFLAKVITASPESRAAPYRDAFRRGLDYILGSQYPNGGWPQVWPLQGGYHDAITYNDGAMVHILELLRKVTQGHEEFKFVPERQRSAARRSLDLGLRCVLRTQVVTAGRRTVWGQQHDALTLQPTSARNYEMPALASGESADLARFLMRLPEPNAEVRAAIRAAAAWFEKTQLRDVAFRDTGAEGRKLVSAPGGGPLWARYYEIGSDRPIFGDRDKTIHDEVNAISAERRRGYAWFTDKGESVLKEYARWQPRQPQD